MHFTVKISDWEAHAPGLSSSERWQEWADNDADIYPSAPYARLHNLPIMTARRLNSGSRLALESSLTLFLRHQPDVLLFTSQHGELERNFRILTALSEDLPVSPTDFALSVHNSAVGSLAITLKKPLVSTSLSAGMNTFHQGMVEARALLSSGYKKVLLVDFEGEVPDFYREKTPVSWAYATAFIVESGDEYQCKSARQKSVSESAPEKILPQSLQFLYSLLRRENQFTISGEDTDWQWSSHK
ncbi:beta-ketoacyl synthase chain length factor [Tatumella sp. UBA2305]|uniref:beta-ketoacyl synthase chain length factor n=1 Tax=Tatumella sp. UBA2305 TaxID=1947647 RepID=UPI0025F2014B|nr:beta-ketoacyl synthase chain length factor [Tatumella sp. UBA2305]